MLYWHLFLHTLNAIEIHRFYDRTKKDFKIDLMGQIDKQV